MKRTGFSRIDLLVVIEISFVVLGLIGPVVQHFRASAARTQCVNNMKHLALAYIHWREVHPKGAFASPGDWNAAATKQHSLLSYFESDASAISSMICPSVNPGAPPSAHYGINDYISRVNRVSFTSGTILFAEYAVNVVASAPDDLTEFPWTYTNFAKSYSTNVQARHPADPPAPGENGSGIFNIAYVDGHVDTVTTSLVSPAGTTNGDANGGVYWNNYPFSRSGD